MPLEKPFRISNEQPFDMFAHIQHPNYTFLSTVQNSKEIYELRIYLPRVTEMEFSIFIEDHIMSVYVFETKIQVPAGHSHSLRIFLPSDVNEEMVTARMEPYGIKVILPRKKMKCTKVKIVVPVFRNL